MKGLTIHNKTSKTGLDRTEGVASDSAGATRLMTWLQPLATIPTDPLLLGSFFGNIDLSPYIM